MNKIYLFLLTLFAMIGVSQTAQADIWVNLPGEYNGWNESADGVKLNDGTSNTITGYTVHRNVAIGNKEFKVRTYNTEGGTTQWYGVEKGFIPMNEWVQLVGGDAGKNFFIDGSHSERVYDVYFDFNNNKIKVVDAGTPLTAEVVGTFNDWGAGTRYVSEMTPERVARIEDVPVGDSEFKVLVQPYSIYISCAYNESQKGMTTGSYVNGTTAGGHANTTINGATTGRHYHFDVNFVNTQTPSIRVTPTVKDKYVVIRLYDEAGNVVNTINLERYASGSRTTNFYNLDFYGHRYLVTADCGYGEISYGKNRLNRDQQWNGRSINFSVQRGSTETFGLLKAVDGAKTTIQLTVQSAAENGNPITAILATGSNRTTWIYLVPHPIYTYQEYNFDEGMEGGTLRYVAHEPGEWIQIKMNGRYWTPAEDDSEYHVSDSFNQKRIHWYESSTDTKIVFDAPGTYYITVERFDDEDEDPGTEWFMTVDKRDLIQIEGWSYSVNDGERVAAKSTSDDQLNNGMFGFSGPVCQGDIIRFYYDDMPVSFKDDADYVINEVDPEGVIGDYTIDSEGYFIVEKAGAVHGEKVFYLSIAFVKEVNDYSYPPVENNYVVIRGEDYVEKNWSYAGYTAGIGMKDMAYNILHATYYPFERAGDDYVIRDIRCYESANPVASSFNLQYTVKCNDEYYTTDSNWPASFVPMYTPSLEWGETSIRPWDNQTPSESNAYATFGCGGSAIFEVRLTYGLKGWAVSATAKKYEEVPNLRFLELVNEDGELVNDGYKTPVLPDEDGYYYYTAVTNGPVRLHYATTLEPGNITYRPDFSYCQMGYSYNGQVSPAGPVEIALAFGDEEEFNQMNGTPMRKASYDSAYYVNLPMILNAEKGLTYKIMVEKSPYGDDSYYIKAYTDGTGGEFPQGWLTTTTTRGGAVGFYLSGDINTWCSVFDRNWEYQTNTSATTSQYKGAEYKGYFCHEESGEFDYRQDDVDHPYLAWPTVADINRHWRFMPVKPQDNNIGYGQVVDSYETNNGKQLGEGEWYVLDLSKNGASDFYGHAGRLCGQFKIIQGCIYSDNCFATSGGANDGYYNNVIKTGQTDYYTNGPGSNRNGQNLSTQSTYVDNAVIYFNAKNGQIYIEGDPVDSYVYYALISKDEEGNPDTSFAAPSRTKLTTLSQANYFAPQEPFENSRKLDNLDLGWEEVTNVPYTLNDGTVITLAKAYRKKIPAALAHRNPAGYTVTVSRQNGSLFPQQRIDCGDVWFIESETYAYFRYADDILNVRPEFKAYFNAWIDQYDNNGIITDNKLYQTAQFAEMEWVDEVEDADMPAKYQAFQGMGWFRSAKPIHRDFSVGGYAMFADTYGGFYPAGAPNVSTQTKEEMQLQGVNFFYVVDLSPRVRILYDKLNGTYAIHRDGHIDGSGYRNGIQDIYDYLEGDQFENYAEKGSVFSTPYVLQINAEFLRDGSTSEVITDYARGIKYRFRVYNEKGQLVENSLNGYDIQGNDSNILPDYYKDPTKVTMADTGWVDEPFFSWGLDQELKDFGAGYDAANDDTAGKFRMIVVQVMDEDGNIYTSQDIYEFYR